MLRSITQRKQQPWTVGFGFWNYRPSGSVSRAQGSRLRVSAMALHTLSPEPRGLQVWGLGLYGFTADSLGLGKVGGKFRT